MLMIVCYMHSIHYSDLYVCIYIYMYLYLCTIFIHIGHDDHQCFNIRSGSAVAKVFKFIMTL